MKAPRPLRSFPRAASAFTLIEVMVVLAIMIVIFALSAPVLKSFGTGNLSAAASAIQGAFDQARTYAMSHNTYTWVGLFEEDGALESQKPARSGVGRLVICIVASQDGTSIYNKTNAENLESQQLASSRLGMVGKLVKLENVHVINVAAQAVGKRPAGIIRQDDLVGLASGTSLFSFHYPLSGATVYTFGLGPVPGASGVVQFNPQGEAASNVGSLSNPSVNLEVAIQGARGTHPENGANVIALDVSGLTGQTTLYRP